MCPIKRDRERERMCEKIPYNYDLVNDCQYTTNTRPRTCNRERDRGKESAS